MAHVIRVNSFIFALYFPLFLLFKCVWYKEKSFLMENVGFPNFLCFAKKDEKIVSLSKKIIFLIHMEGPRPSFFLAPWPQTFLV